MWRSWISDWSSDLRQVGDLLGALFADALPWERMVGGSSNGRRAPSSSEGVVRVERHGRGELAQSDESPPGVAGSRQG